MRVEIPLPAKIRGFNERHKSDLLEFGKSLEGVKQAFHIDPLANDLRLFCRLLNDGIDMFLHFLAVSKPLLNVRKL
jgi:hypothetical protein